MHCQRCSNLYTYSIQENVLKSVLAKYNTVGHYSAVFPDVVNHIIAVAQ